MRVLDLDMDFFMDEIASFIDVNEKNRLSEEYNDCVWGEDRVRLFLENNLGLSKNRKIPGRVLVGHDEALYFWEELVKCGKLSDPFDVVHVDSHPDLGLGCISSVLIFFDDILTLPMNERRKVRSVKTKTGECGISIADYLLWAIAYGLISKLEYCGNPLNEDLDIPNLLFKNPNLITTSDGKLIGDIQLMHSSKRYDTTYEADEIRRNSQKDPEIKFLATNIIDNIKYNGDFDFVSIAQSPNYTPERADFILDIFKEYIIEI